MTLENLLILGGQLKPFSGGQYKRFFYCKYEQYHEYLKNLTSADVYFGGGNAILEENE